MTEQYLHGLRPGTYLLGSPELMFSSTLSISSLLHTRHRNMTAWKVTFIRTNQTSVYSTAHTLLVKIEWIQKGNMALARHCGILYQEGYRWARTIPTSQFWHQSSTPTEEKSQKPGRHHNGGSGRSRRIKLGAGARRWSGVCRWRGRRTTTSFRINIYIQKYWRPK